MKILWLPSDIKASGGGGPSDGDGDRPRRAIAIAPFFSVLSVYTTARHRASQNTFFRGKKTSAMGKGGGQLEKRKMAR
jgi:hypothetical protein